VARPGYRPSGVDYLSAMSQSRDYRTMNKQDSPPEPANEDLAGAAPATPPETPTVESAPAAASGVPLELPIEAVKRLEDELAGFRDRHARLAAEFDNYRKRVTRENAVLVERSQAALTIKVLDVLDDLDRIIDGADEGTPAPTLLEALTLVDRKLRKELESAGLERIDPIGDRFDPAVHEAVATTPAMEPGQDDHVSATFQAGYLFKGNLIRPARVQVFSDQGQG
jgi:molecular chaperone GrpE